ncbi:unnamed protein product [Staurois parvus]|uniref:Uncharacterized protein n=1 Tax=Staurois parvus TaxID=386267 RepID=A0ABN9FAM1_9NEOB|nr:unnamed protein product [Staurois parvus]
MYIHTETCTYTCTHRHMYVHTHMYTHRHMYTQTYMYIHADACTDTHMYNCTCIHRHTHRHTHVHPPLHKKLQYFVVRSQSRVLHSRGRQRAQHTLLALLSLRSAIEQSDGSQCK